MIQRILIVIIANIVFTFLLYIFFCEKDIGIGFFEWVYADLRFDCIWGIFFTLVLNTIFFAFEILAIYLGYVDKYGFDFSLEQTKNYFIVFLY